NALGYSLTNLTDRHEEALALITKALILMPESFHIIDSMGWVLFHLGKLDDSLKYLSKAYSMVRDPEIAAHLIEVLWLLGQQTEAKELLEKAMKEFPADVRLKSVRDRFDL
ncbi:MAG: hypothetical protein VX986_08185, partial [Pseudomonadota bacterium]|nr:hypothetical protein [Pseudomonadota bacterium]